MATAVTHTPPKCRSRCIRNVCQLKERREFATLQTPPLLSSSLSCRMRHAKRGKAGLTRGTAFLAFGDTGQTSAWAGHPCMMHMLG